MAIRSLQMTYEISMILTALKSNLSKLGRTLFALHVSASAVNICMLLAALTQRMSRISFLKGSLASIYVTDVSII